MPFTRRSLLAAALAAGVLAPVRAGAQASSYIPLDDPRLPLIEHLIARGDIPDPSPLVRPFRRREIAEALAAADSAAGHPSGGLLRALRLELATPEGEKAWQLEGRVGAQAYSHPRRELLHPVGTDGVRPYAALRAEAVIGPFALVTRPVGEPRLVDDPDWPGRSDLEFIGRMADAYLSAQFGWGTLFYGQMDRNWGPVGLPGIGLSNYGYGREAAALDVGTRDLRLHALAADLSDEFDAGGEAVHRYLFAHRLGVRLSERFRAAIWESTVVAGPDRKFDGRFRNPLSLLLLANQYGQGDDGANVIVGLDLHWRAFRRATFQAQLAVDDFQYRNQSGPTRYPNRWALTVSGFGPVGRTLGWRALYTQASSLAFRTIDPFENFTERGVGLGRNFADMDQLSVTLSVPVMRHWLVTPELTVLRQGQGRINDPFPATPAEAGQIPQIFIGVVERTYRAAVGLSGRRGPLDLQATAGFHRVVNSLHQEGSTVHRFEGRLQVTLGLRRGGVLQ
ncbi:MAG: hypothetical protein H0T44_12050 [Gemmatimonadales bacterium]|nr:hypothetical protein [Gemmatimonadales bacterium]MDQ3427845.1 hypothetical protein [Gemmatimonadota bacterium]